MPLNRWTIIVIAWFLALSSTYAQESDEADPLFRSSEILEVRIVAPFTTLVSERPEDEEVAGVFQYTNEAGEPEEIDVSVRTRGRFRRQAEICRFPPLRLNFKKSQTKKSLFHKQDKLKLVTHCKNKSRNYRKALLSEYIAYRILNELSEVSFRVRLLRITYVNTEKDNREQVNYGFLIESEERLAKRLGVSIIDLEQTKVSSLKPSYLNLISMYHYLIGNTDFSPIAGAEETCCHNHVLMGNDGERLFSVPYDFDQAGLVNAPHAGVNPRFKLRTVRQRLYRGRCVNNQFIDANIALFKDKREAILQLVSDAHGIEDAPNKSMSRYIEQFYTTIDLPTQVNSQLVKRCI